MAYKDLNKSAEDINDILDNALLKTQQTLTEQQKTQVKKNLGISNTSITFSATSSASVPLTITINDVPKKVTYLYASEAKKLSTSRTIWGQSFDGSNNVNGRFTLTEGQVTFSISAEDPSFVSLITKDVALLNFDSANRRVRPGISLTDQVELGASNARWKAAYVHNLSIGVGFSMSSTTILLINTAADNPYYGFYHDSKRWYIQGYNGMIYIGNGSTMAVRIDSGGNITVPGRVTESSDLRAKDIVGNIDLSLEDIAELSTIKFKWNGFEDKIIASDEIQVGGIAQEVEKILPQAVITTPEGLKTLDYSKCAYIFAVTVAKHLKELKERLLN